MSRAVMQQAYTLSEENVNDLLGWLRAGQINRAVIALEHLNPAELAQPVQPEPVYQCQLAGGTWIDQTEDSYKYNVKLGQAVVRIVFTSPPQRQTDQEPFGYFKPEPFGWIDCEETDEGARPLYEKPFGIKAAS